jgi:ABC-type lipoprotein release transport system permease subunit
VANVAARRLLVSALPDLPASPGMAPAIGGALFLIAALASYLPARRASRLDALAALRES